MSEQESRYTQTDGSLDELAKGLATGTVSRRGMLRMMGAALVGGALASIPGVAWASHKPDHGGTTTTGPCRPGEFRCGPSKGKYVCCPEVASCVKGQCVCPNGGTVCPGNTGSNTCVDSTTDPLNCGSCGSSCAAGEGCCNGNCTNLSTELNCGSCGNACSGGKTCQGGVCACPQGQTDCGGVCRDLLTDVANCGLCGNACAVGASCVNGQCLCPTGQEVCPGNNTCVTSCSTTSGELLNPETCKCECPTGTLLCNNACLSTTCPHEGEVFNATTCKCECPTGTTLCPGNNTCVQDCPSGQTLNATTCQCENIVCPDGTVLCGGQCVSTSCPSGQVFNATTCQCEACPTGQEPCGGQCVSTSCGDGQVFDPNTCTCVTQNDPQGCCFCCGSLGTDGVLLCATTITKQSGCSANCTFTTNMCGSTCCGPDQSCVNGVCV